jgi:excisionase family DNA binding protein
LETEVKKRSPEYLTTGAVAKLCGVSKVTVLRWITTEQLPAFRLPSGHYRIEREDFSEFLRRYSMPLRYRHHETNEKNRSERNSEHT